MRLGGRTAPSPMRVRLHLIWSRALRGAQGVPVCVCVGALHRPARHLCHPAGSAPPAEPCRWKRSGCFFGGTCVPTSGRSPEAGRPRQGAPGGRADARAAGPGGRQGPLPPLGQRARARRAAHEHLQRRAGAPCAPRAPAAGGLGTRRACRRRAAALQWAMRRQRPRPQQHRTGLAQRSDTIELSMTYNRLKLLLISPASR